ncbi:serine hydrolase [Aestuariibacter sp. A3R04]|uniref:serine hydrolase domain-containing protein n=1 Tax=Aestuariibacter sp. A3R04 TaxID=2841571 RepID=UPI001C0A3A0B|nr:serine hydrolase domain-containing protein [Aestuariibacter sp. A3R04]MBU3023817.1 beta-lactamase family protein [Aestuariibacter sp. A3R04]
MKAQHLPIPLFLAAGLALLAGCGSSGDSSSSNPSPLPPVTASYQDWLDDTVGDNIPGLILHVQGDEVSFTGAAGVASRTTFEPMEVYHQMPAGSAGKKATALLVALLHEEGLLNINDLIADYLPDSVLNNIPHSREITILQLLNHTAGVHDYLDADTSAAWFEAGQNSVGTLKSDIDALSFVFNKPAYFAPGEGVHYSNSHYLLAGLVLDNVLGEHHHTALRNRVFIPLGMNNTYYSGWENELGESISGYLLLGDEMLDTRPFYASVGVADAPLVTTVTDLSALLTAIVSDDSPLSEEVRNILVGEDSIIDTPYDMDFGLGIFKELINGKVVFHHGGDEAGYKTTNAYVEHNNTVITLFANCNGYDVCSDTVDALMQAVLASVL